MVKKMHPGQDMAAQGRSMARDAVASMKRKAESSLEVPEPKRAQDDEVSHRLLNCIDLDAQQDDEDKEAKKARQDDDTESDDEGDEVYRRLLQDAAAHAANQEKEG